MLAPSCFFCFICIQALLHACFCKTHFSLFTFISSYFLDVWRVPNLSFLANDRSRQSAHLQQEVAFLQCPASVSTYKSEVFGWQLKGNGLCLTRLQLHFGEVTKSFVVRNDRGDEVTGVEQYRLFTGTTARILHIDRDGQYVIGSETGFVRLYLDI